MKFLDQVKIFIKAGDGGSGSPSFRREKFIEFGGPDGGDGGKGGSIILKSERNLNTLIDFRYQQHFKAQRGEDGKGKKQTGKGGEDLHLRVPVGTQIFEEDNKTAELGSPKVDGAKVEADLIKNGKNRTVLVFKKRRRKNSRRKNGHRQQYSLIQIKKIFAKDGEVFAEAKKNDNKEDNKCSVELTCCCFYMFLIFFRSFQSCKT